MSQYPAGVQSQSQTQVRGSAVSQPGPLDRYRPDPGDADELLLPGGGLRSHWRPLVNALASRDPAALRAAAQDARRLVDELGVTYHVYSDPAGVQRPWPLDAVPHLLDAAEWAAIERGLIQRARLFEWVVKDAFGAQALLRAGVLPPEFLSAHAAYLPALRGTLRPDLPALTLYAADLARGSDGGLRVIGDRAQAPSGAGYALQNREILSRTWPQAFAELGVQGLGHFFRGLHQGLRELAPGIEDPHIVLLSPGPLNEAWFEHVLLARQLGLTLVQGQDLVFRDGRIWLSTLGQLERVDVILRRVDDAWCDPLSLNPESHLGVAGLVEAVRRGNVAVANALGAGLLESPGWPAFLPAIARFAFGEEMLLPSVATWWCGDPEGLEHVLAHRDSLVVRSIDRTEGGRPLFLAEMDPDSRERLCSRIRSQPTRYVGQEHIGLSTMPCLDESGALEARHGTLRVFACHAPAGLRVLPGGLTRVAGRPGTRLVSNQEGGVSKDTWVLRPLAAVPAHEAIPPEPDTGVGQPVSLPRRVADNLLWAGRYAERAEGLTRWLRLVLRRLQTNRLESRAADPVTGAMLRALTHLSGSYPGFLGVDGRGRSVDDPEPELLRLLTDARTPGSVPAALNALQGTANALRDRMSAESVRVLAGLREVAQPLGALCDPFAAEGILGELTVHLLALSGLTHESMLHHHGWRFLDSGRRLERGLLLVSLLRATQVVPPESREAVLLNDMVLVFAESLSVFRSRPARQRNAQGLLDLLLLEPENPRSLIFQLDRLSEHVAQLPRLDHGERLPPYARHLEEARSRLRLAVAADWIEAEGAPRTRLDALLAEQQRQLGEAYQALFGHFLAPAPTLPLIARSTR